MKFQNLEFPHADDGERRRLHPADADDPASLGHQQRFRSRAGEREIENLIGLLARHGRLVERMHLGVRLQPVEGLPEGLRILGGEQRSPHGAAVAQVLEDLLSDQLPFAVAVCRQDDAIAILQRARNRLELY